MDDTEMHVMIYSLYKLISKSSFVLSPRLIVKIEDKKNYFDVGRFIFLIFFVIVPARSRRVPGVPISGLLLAVDPITLTRVSNSNIPQINQEDSIRGDQRKNIAKM